MLEIFVSKQCDHCEWVEQALLKTEEDIKVWDCKRDIRHPSFYKAVERNEGTTIHRIQLPYGVPCAVDRGETLKVLVGAKHIAERIRGERTLFIPGRG